jgi:hypothetical protein
MTILTTEIFTCIEMIRDPHYGDMRPCGKLSTHFFIPEDPSIPLFGHRCELHVPRVKDPGYFLRQFVSREEFIVWEVMRS